MDWIVIGLAAVILFGTWRLFPNLFTARCPICYSRLQSIQELDEIRSWQGWRLVWHRFVCPQCLYRWRRIEIARCPKGINA